MENAARFRRTKITNDRTRKTVAYLIRKEFDDIAPDAYGREVKEDDLIKTALNLGLSELAAQMTWGRI